MGRHLYSEELVHAVTEAERTQYLPAASWRPSEANAVVPVLTQRHVNQGVQGRRTGESSMAQKPGMLVSKGRIDMLQLEQIHPLSEFLFFSGPLCIRCCPPVLLRVGFHYSIYPLKC